MASAAEALSEAWVDDLVAKTAGRRGVPGINGVVGIGTGKEPSVILNISEGRVMGVSKAEPEVLIPISPAQLEAWSNGELLLSVAYMKGDLKPVGSTGALLAALEVLDNL